MKRFKILAVAAATSLVFTIPRFAYGFSIIKVADTNTPIPGGTGTFTRFDLTSGRLFIAEGAGRQAGIYTFGLSALFDTNTPAPGFGPGVNFAGFSSVSEGGYGTSFIGTTTTGEQAVYDYWAANGEPGLLLIAQTGQSPSAGVSFGNFTNVSSTYQINPGGNANGEFLSDAGIYNFSVTLADPFPPYTGYSVSLTQQATTIPPSTFSTLGQPNFKAPAGGVVPGVRLQIQVVRAIAGGAEGVYYNDQTTDTPLPFTKLVDTNTIVPGGTGTFTSFGDPTADIDNIVFTAHYNNAGNDQQGIFSWGPYYYGPATGLHESLAAGIVAPDSGGAHFKDFLGVTPEGTFLADLDNGTEGIYSLEDLDQSNSTDTISDILDTTESLDGKAIKSFDLSREADVFGYGTASAFIVNFTDGSQGLYYFAVPEPASLALLPLALLFIRRNRNTA